VLSPFLSGTIICLAPSQCTAHGWLIMGASPHAHKRPHGKPHRLEPPKRRAWTEHVHVSFLFEKRVLV
jgi:hypothetical protein